jgi:hypothetical protein
MNDSGRGGYGVVRLACELGCKGREKNVMQRLCNCNARIATHMKTEGVKNLGRVVGNM